MTRSARQMMQPALMVACALAALMILAAPAAPARADGGPPLTRIAFGSCAHQDKPQPIWDAILDYRPELFVFAGDNVYGDLAPGAPASRSRTPTPRPRPIPGYRAVRARVPVLATWDDHDYGQNDAGGDFPYKEQAKALFLDFWHVPADDPRRDARGHLSRRGVRPGGHARCRSSCSTPGASARR